MLKVGYLFDFGGGLDPAQNYDFGWGVLRLMTRTLYAWTETTGSVSQLAPDIAENMPKISSDGLTYTISIRQGVKFGPPLDQQVVCADFQTAFERMFSPKVPAAYNFYYTVIQGANSFQSGKANSISGITCPNDQTIVFKLTQPTGDFLARLTLFATSPVPAVAVKGHDQDYGRFIVSTGPYTYQGMSAVDFSLPASGQTPPPGYSPNRSMTLVRNPDWSQSTDAIRKAYPDEIAITFGGETQSLYEQVQSGALDAVEGDAITPPQVLSAFTSNPSLNGFWYSRQLLGVRHVYINVTIPPFDDVHVRKAMNWVVNKASLARLYGGPAFGQIATHVLAPAADTAVPPTYDQYATPGSQGSVAKAKQEMMLSKYDPSQDGLCDVSVCKNVVVVVPNTPPTPSVFTSIMADLAKIGITGRIQSVSSTTWQTYQSDPTKNIPLGYSQWVEDYNDPYTLFEPRYGAIGKPGSNSNYSLVSDPHVTSEIAKCEALLADARATCWAGLDQYMMTSVVPIVPFQVWNGVRVFSTNVANVPIPWVPSDLATALDALALTPADIQATASEVKSA